MNNQTRSTSSVEKLQSAPRAKNVTTGQRAGDATSLNTDSYVFIKDMKVGHYDQTFLVHSISANESMVTSAGSRFARVILKDVTGEIEGVIWDYADLEERQYYRIQLDTKMYRGVLEFQTAATLVQDVEAPLNIHDYIKGINEGTLVVHAAAVEEAFQTMTDEHYRNVLGNAIHRLDLIQALKTSPYGLTGPLAYKGGLLVHVAGSLKLAKIAALQAKEAETPLNPSLIIASCLLRNIGWNTTTTFNKGYLKPRDAFYMTGINRASARYVDHLMIHVESDLEMKIPEAKKQALENSCNEIAEIKTIEGRIAATADHMIDLLHFGGESLRRKTKGNWTNDFFSGHNV